MRRETESSFGAGNAGAVTMNAANVCTAALLGSFVTGSVTLQAGAPSTDDQYQVSGAGDCSGTATSVPAYLVWRRLFQTGEVGSAAALGIVLMLIVFAVTYGINRLMERAAER